MRRILIPLAVALAPAVMVTLPVLTAHAQDVAPIANAVISSVTGRDGMINAGTADGVRTGAVYEVVRDGRVVARARVTRTYGARSEVRFSEIADGAVVTVGDAARFVTMAVAALPAAPAPAPAAPVTAPVVAPAPPAAAAPIAPAPPALKRGAVAVNGDNVEFGTGSSGGFAVGKTVPIIKNGNVVAVARIATVTSETATGTIIWRDATATAALTDATAPASPGATDETGAPSARVRFETGGGNFKVPKNAETYNLLASLAADNLIKSQPAWIFHDDGTRRHRTEEDVTFSRAEVAGFVREALANAGDEVKKTRNRVALSSLVTEYRPELVSQGVAEATLDGLGARKGFEIGFSGQSRYSLFGGDDTGYMPAFSEGNGSRRSRTGYDSRTNIFGRLGDRLTFDAQVDAGNDHTRGVNDRNYEVRRAVASYNAGNVLRGLTVDMGRQEYWWGPGHFGTLLLGDATGPLNSIHTTFKRGSYKVESLYSPLGNGPSGGGRSIYGHNIQVQLSPQVRVGFAETVVSPTKDFDGVLALSTFSPIPLTLAQRGAREGGANQNTNLLNSAYFEAGLAKGFTGYGELLVDDLSFTDSSKVRQRIGTLVGAHIFKPNDPGKLGLYTEYANLEGRTYLNFQSATGVLNNYDYYFRGQSFGYPVAPRPGVSPGGGTPGLGGASSLRSDAYWRPTKRLNLGAGLEIADINSELAVISRQQIYRFRASYDIKHNYSVVARAQRISTSNPGFVVGSALRQKLYQVELVRTF